MKTTLKWLAVLCLVCLWIAPAQGSSGSGLWNWYVVPAVANIGGAYSTFWRTDLTIGNPYAYKSIGVTVWYLQENQDNTNAQPRTYTISPLGQIMLEDVVSTQFVRPGTKGAVLLECQDGSYFTADARTYIIAGGSYGAAINGQSTINGPAGAAFVAGIRNGSGYRTNVGAVNCSGNVITLVADAYDQSGQLRGSYTMNLLPWSMQQLALSSFSPEFGAGFVRWRCTSTQSDAAWVAYGSVVDNTSGDSIYIEDRPDDQNTMHQPFYDLTGTWSGNIVFAMGSEQIYAKVNQDGANLSIYLYDAPTGFRISYASGYEDRGIATILGSSSVYQYLGSQFWGNVAINSATSITGTLSGNGAYAGGLSFYLSKISGLAADAAQVASRAAETDHQTDPRCLGQHTP
jgi:hypothetical protein